MNQGFLKKQGFVAFNSSLRNFGCVIKGAFISVKNRNLKIGSSMNTEPRVGIQSKELEGEPGLTQKLNIFRQIKEMLFSEPKGKGLYDGDFFYFREREKYKIEVEKKKQHLDVYL